MSPQRGSTPPGLADARAKGARYGSSYRCPVRSQTWPALAADRAWLQPESCLRSVPDRSQRQTPPRTSRPSPATSHSGPLRPAEPATTDRDRAWFGPAAPLASLAHLPDLGWEVGDGQRLVLLGPVPSPPGHTRRRTHPDRPRRKAARPAGAQSVGFDGEYRRARSPDDGPPDVAHSPHCVWGRPTGRSAWFSSTCNGYMLVIGLGS